MMKKLFIFFSVMLLVQATCNATSKSLMVAASAKNSLAHKTKNNKKRLKNRKAANNKPIKALPLKVATSTDKNKKRMVGHVQGTMHAVTFPVKKHHEHFHLKNVKNIKSISVTKKV